MNDLFTKFSLLHLFNPEKVVSEVKEFYKEYYTINNLRSHTAYVSDVKPGRKSHAYAVSHNSAEYPHIKTNDLYFGEKYSNIQTLTHLVRIYLGVSNNARLLFNIQEYYSDSAEVPKHNDGELLEFSVDPDGSLNIYESLRPAKVAVLTIVNDVKNGAGTRIWNGNKSSVVKCKVGDILVFDNIQCLHSVDAFGGKAKRKDGLLRLIIGWRSLDETCVHEINNTQYEKTTEQVKSITRDWLVEKWPDKWKNIEQNLSKAAF